LYKPCYKYQFQGNGKALSSGATEGFVKIVSVDNIIKGVHIIGANASDIIHQAVVLLNKNASINDLNEMIFAHPTLSEALGHCLR
jgi:dihydrolipoamide dehydrogenase